MSVGAAPPTWAAPSGSLDDARHRAGSNSRADGLKVQAAISGSENVVGAILFGTYWFARIVNELSVHSRLASLRSTTTVETDHPLLSFQLPDAPRSRRPSNTTVYNRPSCAVKTETHRMRKEAPANTRKPRPYEHRCPTGASWTPAWPPSADCRAPVVGAKPAQGTPRTE